VLVSVLETIVASCLTPWLRVVLLPVMPLISGKMTTTTSVCRRHHPEVESALSDRPPRRFPQLQAKLFLEVLVEVEEQVVVVIVVLITVGTTTNPLVVAAGDQGLEEEEEE
jgi:hypothetical protein